MATLGKQREQFERWWGASLRAEAGVGGSSERGVPLRLARWFVTWHFRPDYTSGRCLGARFQGRARFQECAHAREESESDSIARSQSRSLSLSRRRRPPSLPELGVTSFMNFPSAEFRPSSSIYFRLFLGHKSSFGTMLTLVKCFFLLLWLEFYCMGKRHDMWAEDVLFGGAIDCSFVCLFVCDDKYCFMRCCVQLPCSLCIYVTVLLYLGSLMSITCYYY